MEAHNTKSTGPRPPTSDPEALLIPNAAAQFLAVERSTIEK